jgi:hypothetical protein
MKKKLNTSGILNELTGKSAFFKRPEQPKSNDRTEKRTQIRTENRSVPDDKVYPTKRLTRRYSFEFYDDQITQIKKIKHELEMQGKRISLSDVVRKALDEYLNK